MYLLTAAIALKDENKWKKKKMHSQRRNESNSVKIWATTTTTKYSFYDEKKGDTNKRLCKK